MTFVNGLNYSEVSADATEDDKFIAFKKRKSEEVVKDILKFENQEALKDNPNEDEKKKIAERMKKATDAGYDPDHTKNFFKVERYGNPEKPKEITSEQLVNFLFDEKMGSFTKASKALTEAKNSNAFVSHMKAHG